MKSLGPASIKRTDLLGRYSVSLDAITQPAVPPPTMTKSYEASLGSVVVVVNAIVAWVLLRLVMVMRNYYGETAQAENLS
jgi:hypothetical protein